MADCSKGFHSFPEWAREYLRRNADSIAVPSYFRQKCTCRTPGAQMPVIRDKFMYCAGCDTQLHPPIAPTSTSLESFGYWLYYQAPTYHDRPGFPIGASRIVSLAGVHSGIPACRCPEPAGLAEINYQGDTLNCFTCKEELWDLWAWREP